MQFRPYQQAVEHDHDSPTDTQQVTAGSKTRAGLNARPSSCPRRDPGDLDSLTDMQFRPYQQAAEHDDWTELQSL
jgi:hypothetical protein